MRITEIIFLVATGTILFAYLCYPLLTGMLFLAKKWISKDVSSSGLTEYLPEISLVIPCYNEASVIKQKIENCFSLDYPSGKISFIFITDGSTDESDLILAKYPSILHLHQTERAGKAAALNRAMQFAQSEIVFFSDANSMVNREAILRMVHHFSNSLTGCVSGEKRVLVQTADNASAAGEGIYWKYESLVKKMDAGCNSTIGAIGELMAVRRSLFHPLRDDTILDDFVMSMQIAAAGYKIAYEPGAIALEKASLNMKEELKRKTRIATGNWQALHLLSGKLHVTRTPFLCFQYFIQRRLKRALAPFLLLIILCTNIALVANGHTYYAGVLLIQLLFYAAAFTGYLFRNKKTRWMFLFAPYYFCTMNYAAIAGCLRFLKGNYSGAWEKAERIN